MLTAAICRLLLNPPWLLARPSDVFPSEQSCHFWAPSGRQSERPICTWAAVHQGCANTQSNKRIPIRLGVMLCIMCQFIAVICIAINYIYLPDKIIRFIELIDIKLNCLIYSRSRQLHKHCRPKEWANNTDITSNGERHTSFTSIVTVKRHILHWTHLTSSPWFVSGLQQNTNCSWLQRARCVWPALFQTWVFASLLYTSVMLYRLAYLF